MRPCVGLSRLPVYFKTMVLHFNFAQEFVKWELLAGRNSFYKLQKPAIITEKDDLRHIMEKYQIDKLHEAVKTKGHVCVGLDTSAGYLPPTLRAGYANDAAAVLAYNEALIDATAGAAACYKVQIAYYEALGCAGLECYAKTLKLIRKRGIPVIADIKRGDIADTASRYAKAHFYGDFEADFVTLNPYMGMDTLTPWIEEVEKTKKGAFVLLRTSNPGRADFECQKLENGKKLYETLGERLKALAGIHKGTSGFGLFGAVVGCTEKNEAAAIRKEYGNLFFLIPGYGAQGGGAAEVSPLLHNDGSGGVVNASRSILKAWEKAEKQIITLEDAAEAAYNAAVKMRGEIRDYLVSKE
ncbi:orotidine 5'-phosphate decarboxylase [Spirochaetia bacterium]|nr:orotidine 5'-phosphate decarboxylase [Spirochaetia bacterium]